MQKVEIFSTPFLLLTRQELTGLGLASICQPLASEEDSEKIIQPSIRKRRGDQAIRTKRWPRWCIPLPGARICHSCSSWLRSPCCTGQRRGQFHHTYTGWKQGKKPETGVKKKKRLNIKHKHNENGQWNTSRLDFWSSLTVQINCNVYL